MCEAEQTSPFSKQNMSINLNIYIFFNKLSFFFKCSSTQELRAAVLAGGIMAKLCKSHTIKQCVRCSLESNGGGKWKALLRLWKRWWSCHSTGITWRMLWAVWCYQHHLQLPLAHLKVLSEEMPAGHNSALVAHLRFRPPEFDPVQHCLFQLLSPGS